MYLPRVIPHVLAEEPAYQPGSREDFDRLYRNAYPRVFRTLTAILADPAAAEDCAQDAFVQAFQAWDRWKPSAPAEAWVHRIAVNRAISYRRTAKLRTAAELVRRLGRPKSATDATDATGANPDLVTALRALPPKLSAAIVLRHYHGYTNRELATALGVSERTIGERLRQAGERLRAVLGPDFRPEGSRALTSDAVEETYAKH